jgi:hypothetical protein
MNDQVHSYDVLTDAETQVCRRRKPDQEPSAQSKRSPWKLGPVYKLAETHCANWCRGGICEGADVDLKTGRHFRWRRAGCPCLLSTDQRCPYFEQCVLPMEGRKEKDWPTFAQGEAFRKAARLYHAAFPETVTHPPDIRKCPDCGKRPVEPRKRYCSECRNRRRKATDAGNHRNWRKTTDHRHTVNENGSSLGAASRGAILDTRYVDLPESISGPKLYDGERF